MRIYVTSVLVDDQEKALVESPFPGGPPTVGPRAGNTGSGQRVGPRPNTETLRDAASIYPRAPLPGPGALRG
jgi:hypothetical protein